MKPFKTPKGTELPILDFRGKEYLEVKYRLVWFREEHPTWAIETELISVTEKSAYAKATIRDDAGRIIATSHKFENTQGFADFIEKSETGAIGRALALIGYGTQFCADDLDEGKRIVDSPVDRPKTQAPARQAQAASKPEVKAVASKPIPDVYKDVDYGAYECSFGKHKGKKLRDFGENDLESFRQWLEKQPNLSPSAKIFLENSDAYLKTMEFKRDRKDDGPNFDPSDDIPF